MAARTPQTGVAESILADLTGIPVERWATHWAGPALTEDAAVLQARLPEGDLTQENIITIKHDLIESSRVQLRAIAAVVRDSVTEKQAA